MNINVGSPKRVEPRVESPGMWPRGRVAMLLGAGLYPAGLRFSKMEVPKASKKLDLRDHQNAEDSDRQFGRDRRRTGGLSAGTLEGDSRKGNRGRARLRRAGARAIA